MASKVSNTFGRTKRWTIPIALVVIIPVIHLSPGQAKKSSDLIQVIRFANIYYRH